MKMQKKILLYMLGFALVILFIIWMLQTFFLDDIYRNIKKNQIESAASHISRLTEESDFEEKVYDIATKENTCVTVFSIYGGMGKAEITAHIDGHCLIHSAFADHIIGEVYEGALSHSLYTQIYEGENDNFADSILCSVLAGGEGRELLIVLNTEIQPVTATVTTLRYMLLWITIVVAIVATIISYLISRTVTTPVEKMNLEARKLALGNYTVNFDGGGYLETAELAGTLNYAASELSKLDNMQKELIANISHDLRTPLTMISGYGEVMRDIPGEITPENIQIIIDETARLSSLVSDMLDLSRIAGGKRELNLTEFSLAECVRATLERYSVLRERDGYVFRFTCENENATVYADEILILQVVYNLINNAINYSGEDKAVEVALTDEGDSWKISVTDHGSGIPKEKLPLIWDRYYKASDYHRRAVSGTGLGLSIVKNALILHDADFGVSSTVGKGSTFWFSLKKAEDDE